MPSILNATTTNGLVTSADNSGSLQLQTNNGTTAVTIDTSQNVGIGTSSPNTRLDVKSSGIGFEINPNNSGNGVIAAFNRNTINFSTAVLQGDVVRFDTGTLGSNAERMRIDSSGNVGIGTTDGGIRLRVKQDSTSTTDVAGMYLQNGSFTTNTQVGIGFINADNFNAKIYSLRSGSSAGNIVFATNGGGGIAESNVTERMRIDSSGNLLVGTTAQIGAVTGRGVFSSTGNLLALQAGNGSVGAYMTNNSGTGNWQPFSFCNNGSSWSQIGSITCTASATAYNTSSDYRLKENIAPMQGALNVVAQLKPVTYNWKVDGSSGQGFIAHELQAVMPDCVSGDKDAVDADGKPVYQGVDTSFLVATLTAAIQEQQAMIEELKQEVQLLKNPPVEGTE